MYQCDCCLLWSREGHSLLQSAKKIAPLPAAPKLNMKVSLHSATQCMVVVIDTLCDTVSMSRIMAVSVEGEFITQFFSSSLTFRRDVIYFYEISWPKK
jgi:hypothetical protein